ncbi:unnamed protein product [Tilletia controversa]|uniref:Nuclear transport factor 2 n=3 Tax=Tilletia TaxID=13289 RepID=A0A8X7STS3_9BASI|nr:hypothetical protein CF336_g6773 [Tilletia laevis]KAE8187425.1 hypothetical protein CF328_g6919 [Tilletia controversa]KAE8251764.1 hypothetical protein A4X03_0g6321 [Tilletia caries]KAE8191698.1 hypothetical protein CF335_g6017 [Tilletia laevis]KAE8241108.1 hypothetical protein A4X06_0g7663 [Tilletia controversa]
MKKLKVKAGDDEEDVHLDSTQTFPPNTLPAPICLPSMNMDTIATEFTNFYYQTFDSNRSQLGSLYRPNSMLTFEGQPFQGNDAIVEKLASLPFQKVVHQVGTRDVQPTGADQSSLFVLVTGALVVDDGEHPMNFTQAFTLAPDGAGSFYVYNDCFRLSFG